MEIIEFISWLRDYWWLIVILAIWSVVWKGLALWKAARRKELAWFVIILIVNTAGLLEIFYWWWKKEK